MGLPEIINVIQNIRSGLSPAETNSENVTSEKAIPEELAYPATDSSAEKHQNFFSDDSRVKKPPSDASVIKNILQSGTNETYKKAHNQKNAVNSEPITHLTQVQEQEQTSYSQQNEDNSSIEQSTVDSEKSIKNGRVFMEEFTQTPETSETFSQTPETRETRKIHKKREIIEIKEKNN